MGESRLRIPPEELKKLPPDKRCKIALDVALNVLMKECGDKNTLTRTIAEVLGLNPDDINPVSEHCMRVFEIGLNKETCSDFRFIRSWVMCEAWKLIDEKKLMFGQAIRTAWKIAKEICAEEGVMV